MLYVSTRNPANTYTAHWAIYETNPPEGGMYAPFHLPRFSQEEIADIRSGGCCEAVTKILNFFFGLRLCSTDVESVIGCAPFCLAEMSHKLVIAESFSNPTGTYRYLVKSLYNLLTDGKSEGKSPEGWAYIAIRIALLFGIFAEIKNQFRTFDVAVDEDDFADLTAVCYARDMGLPIRLIVSTSVGDSLVWDLLNKGSCAVIKNDYFENFLYHCFGTVTDTLALDEEQLAELSEKVYAVVVSGDRAASVTANMYRSNGYVLSADAALAYGGLQDYRSATGVSNDTLILAKAKPEPVKE